MSTVQQAFDRFDPETAWDEYFPNGGNRWDAAKVAHLYRRAAFGGTRGEIDAGVQSAPAEVIRRLVDGGEGQEEFEQDAARVARSALDSGEPARLKGAWLYRMVHSPHPLRERMTLFWHNHFATSNAKVADVRLMQRQNDLLRRHALGHFSTLLHEITFDPAMLVWLDSNTNKKGQPNENYAREIFELFSLGVGNYTEQDIKEAARALTGWRTEKGRAVFNPAEHDRSEKTVLGQTGPWGAGDVVRIALAQPACARFLVRKVFRELASETVAPSDEMLEPLVTGYRLRDYDTGWLVERILRSWAFYSPAALRQRVKGPVEFAVGSVRALDGRASPMKMGELCDQLGQALFYPPSVKGWDAGGAWLNSTTLLFRQNFAFDVTRGTGEAAGCDPARLARKHGLEHPDQIAEFFLHLFLQQPDHPSRGKIVAQLETERERLRREFLSTGAVGGMLARTAAHLVMTLPEYQLS